MREHRGRARLPLKQEPGSLRVWGQEASEGVCSHLWGNSVKNQQQTNSRVAKATRSSFLLLIHMLWKSQAFYEACDFDLQMKYNLPSWCDRVLWKSYPLVHVVCQSYGE